jgi:glycyl-tRNA synthetase
MRALSSLLRINHLSSLRKPLFNTPHRRVYPTKSFSTTPIHHKYQPLKRTKEPAMVSDMTTLKGKPFDRPALEGLMRVRNVGAFRQ